MSLAREIAAALPRMMADHPKGPLVKDIAAFIAAPEANVRRAMDTIKAEALAIVVRRPGEKGRRVVPRGYEFGFKHARVCPWCDLLFQAPAKSKRLCCSSACKNSWTWANPDIRAKRSAGIKAALITPEALARTAAHNKRRWSKPGEREKMAEQNRRQWADPVARAKRSASIQKNHGTPTQRARYGALLKERWKDPEKRARHEAAIRAGKNKPEARAKFSENMRKRWKDPKHRAAFLAATKRNGAKAAARVRAEWADPEKRPALLAAQRERAAKAQRTRIAQIPARAQLALEALRMAPRPMTAGEMERALNLSPNAARSALRSLERRGMIESTACAAEHARKPGDGSGSHSKIAWRLKAQAKAA